MATGRQEAEWGRTSFLLAMMHNTVQGIKQQEMKTPDDFNPYAVKVDRGDDLEVPFDTLKLFVTGAVPT